MRHSMTAISGLGGAAARAGPSADAVAVAAQRLAGIAQELERLRLQLGRLNAMDWRSPAAAAFRDSLSERNFALSAVARDIAAAGTVLASYALALQSQPSHPGDALGMGVPGMGVPGLGLPGFGVQGFEVQGFGVKWPAD